MSTGVGSAAGFPQRARRIKFCCGFIADFTPRLSRSNWCRFYSADPLWKTCSRYDPCERTLKGNLCLSTRAGNCSLEFLTSTYRVSTTLEPRRHRLREKKRQPLLGHSHMCWICPKNTIHVEKNLHLLLQSKNP